MDSMFPERDYHSDGGGVDKRLNENAQAICNHTFDDATLNLDKQFYLSTLINDMMMYSIIYDTNI